MNLIERASPSNWFSTWAPFPDLSYFSDVSVKSLNLLRVLNSFKIEISLVETFDGIQMRRRKIFFAQYFVQQGRLIDKLLSQTKKISPICALKRPNCEQKGASAKAFLFCLV